MKSERRRGWHRDALPPNMLGPRDAGGRSREVMK